MLALSFMLETPYLAPGPQGLEYTHRYTILAAQTLEWSLVSPFSPRDSILYHQGAVQRVVYSTVPYKFRKVEETVDYITPCTASQLVQGIPVPVSISASGLCS